MEDPLQTQIRALADERRRLKAQLKRTTAEFKNTTKRRRRLIKSTSKLSDADLQYLLQQRQQTDAHDAGSEQNLQNQRGIAGGEQNLQNGLNQGGDRDAAVEGNRGPQEE